MKKELLMILMILAVSIGFGFSGAQNISATEKIVFSANRDVPQNDIYVMNSDGSNPVRLTVNTSQDLEPSFSPDGGKIVFRADRDGNDEIYIMNADGTNQTNLTNNPGNDLHPSFSPDGTKIVFSSQRDGNEEIYVMNVDGTNQTRLTNNTAGDGQPEFSPDGTKIVFITNRDVGNNLEIYLMNPDGTNQTNLTNHPGTEISPTFSPDGSKIAFISTRDGNTEIYVMNADGTNQTNVSNAASFEHDPEFSPDGSQIAFRSNRDGNAELYKMNADGTSVVRLTNNTAFDSEPSWTGQADSDNDGLGDACDNQAPVAQCKNVTVTLADGQMTAAADINDGSFDPDGDMISLMYSPAGPYGVGQTVVTLTVNDGIESDSCMGTVTVLYQFEFFGYSDLLSNPMYFNMATAGSNVPVRFSLNGFQGDPYSQPPTSHPISCVTKAQLGPATVIDRFAPDPYYSPFFDFYQTTWKTPVGWKFTCRRLTLYFKDGTTRTLDFNFK